MSERIVVVGSLNLDFVTRAERLPAPGETIVAREFATFHGGKGANQAYAAARLGGRVAMVGRVGADSHGEALKRNLSAVGIDTSAVTCDSHAPSGMAFITTDAAGQNSIVIVPGANHSLTPERLDAAHALFAGAGVVLLQFETPMETVIRAARLAEQAGARVLLDPAPARDVPDELFALADYVTPNETELLALAAGARIDGDAAEAAASDVERTARGAHVLLSRGARNVLVKMGAAGALLVGPDGKERHWKGFAVEAMDTTAAGDCFNAAFAVGLAEGMTAGEAGQLATAAAALSVTRPGAQASMPSRAEVERFVRERQEPVEE